MYQSISIIFIIVCIISTCHAYTPSRVVFVAKLRSSSINTSSGISAYSKTSRLAAATGAGASPVKKTNSSIQATKLKVDLGEGYKIVDVSLLPVFETSTFHVFTYAVPFGLNIEKPEKGFPCAIVTKDSSNNQEKRGDILRACTCWSQGFSAAGAMSDIMQFAGNVRWRKSVYDCTGSPWESTLDALMSNIPERSSTVTLIFERDASDAAEASSD